MSNLVTELHIIDGDRNIFDTETKYIIPLYQRAYAWEDKQLTQLIEDIEDVDENSNYYIGSLIVSRQGDKYEVIDGQQRLTSLFILLNCLDPEKPQQTLTFACRDRSNYTLRNIKDILDEDRKELDRDRIESSIRTGKDILSKQLNKMTDEEKNSFKEKLSRVIVYRIEVPPNTDLNRYFEIMNTRGEQLEQHDILKASLMSYLKNDSENTTSNSEMALFAKIWEACSDMTGYVQMHFINKNRESIFGNDWRNIPSNKWNDYKKIIQEGDSGDSGHQICDIINQAEVENDEEYSDEDPRASFRFESIINFPYFLLHTLRVYVGLNKIEHEKKDQKIVDDLLDDKKLTAAFDRVTSNGVYPDGRKIEDDKGRFAREFILCLLRTRFLFDEYIIKREYANDNTDGEWSIKSLHVSGQQSKKKPYYRNSRFIKSNEWDKTNNTRTKTNIMIQSALRVSYTSPKIMHWITTLLIYLSESDCIHLKNNDITTFDKVAENVAIDAVSKFLTSYREGDKKVMGVNTPHIVFNYLDYRLWLEDSEKSKKLYSDFVFEFRNSVEHWYPQNPSEETFEQWKDGVDQFGNLCIIQRNVNSKFSNMSPEAKKSTFEKMIAKGSIKLRKMSMLTEKTDGETASRYWKKTACKYHEEEMMGYLEAACNP